MTSAQGETAVLSLSSAESDDGETRRKRQRINGIPAQGNPNSASSSDPENANSETAPVQTPWTVACATYPELESDPVKEYEIITGILLKKPAVNSLVENINAPERFNLSRRSRNLEALLAQITGKLLSGESACVRCKTGKGQWHGCVLDRDKLPDSLMEGACANCYYDGRPDFCSFQLESTTGLLFPNSVGSPVQETVRTRLPKRPSRRKRIPDEYPPSLSIVKRSYKNDHSLAPPLLGDLTDSIRAAMKLPAEDQKDVLDIYRQSVGDLKTMIGLLEFILGDKAN